MATLLIRLCGPMQSWGTRSRFSERDTELEPSKSGVVGLLCAALGWSRTTDVSDLAALRMGVRVDMEGIITRDYQTAGAGTGMRRASGDVSTDAVPSSRYYLAGADFLVGLEGGDAGFLHQLDEAVRAPIWQLSLGRKAFVPALPIALPLPIGGVRQADLESALQREPWPLSPSPWSQSSGPEGRERTLRFVIETSLGGNADIRFDQPMGAAFAMREFGPRAVVTHLWTVRREENVPEPTHA